MSEMLDTRLEVAEPLETDSFENEERELFAELTDTLRYAVASGFCTGEQAQDWIDGYENCGDRLDWKRNIVRILVEKCMPSGERQQENAYEILRSSYLSTEYKRRLEQELNSADSYHREELLEEARREIAAKKRQEDEFNKLIVKINLASAKKRLEQEFGEADSTQAAKVLKQAEKYADQKSGVIEFTGKEQKISQAVQGVEQCLLDGDFNMARQYLNAIGAELNFSGLYRELLEKIDAQQTKKLQQSLRAA